MGKLFSTYFFAYVIIIYIYLYYNGISAWDLARG